MFGTSYSHQRAFSQALPITSDGDSERRRSLRSFLVWPFLLGAAFVSDDLSASARAAADEQNAAASPTSEETHSPAGDGSLNPVSLSDWEVSDPSQSTQNLLPEPPFPAALAAGSLEQPVASTPLGTHASQGNGGGGGGSSSGGGEAEGVAHAGGSDLGPPEGVHVDVGSETIGEVVQSVLATAEGLVHVLDGGIGGSSLSASGTLLSDVAHSSGDVVASAGTIAFGPASHESFMPALTINGSYTDFGIAVQPASTETHVTSTDHPEGAALDLGHSVDQHDPNGTGSIHLNDDTNLRTPMDLWG
jgi:hypothetical protein